MESGPAGDSARAIHSAFASYMAEFAGITLRSKGRFEARDWAGQRADSASRLNLYGRILDDLLSRLKEGLGSRVADREVWAQIKIAFADLVRNDRNPELARTFYNSATRRILGTVGVSASIEFTALDPDGPAHGPDPRLYRRYEGGNDLDATLRTVLQDYPFAVGYRDAEGDGEAVARRIEDRMRGLYGCEAITAIELLRPVFYRSKGAYIVGRIHCGDRVIPLILALLNSKQGVFVDAVLLCENEASILFSFTRSYFLVEADCPGEVIAFLRTTLPRKPVEDLYSALGCNKHGKTELYRSLRRHLSTTPDRFIFASGDRGMVMLVFTLPSYDMVFKIIRDEFAPPKSMTPREVMNRYRFVFERDRVGRLVEAQQFRHLKIPVDRFSESLLQELIEGTARTVAREGDFLVFDLLYTERKVRPLNLYLREVEPDAAFTAIIDYGAAIKELAAANIFPGDFLLKNFGVTRHGRVVFYDYDELCLLTDCNFRSMPPARTHEDEMASEPWFSVGENDIFPEEFRKFLGLSGQLLRVFEEHHGDLLTARFWKDLQAQHNDGALLNFFPYPASERIRTDS